MHVHFHAATRTHAPAVIADAGLSAAISVWDTETPPRPYDEDLAAWRSLEPRLLRCHVPDLSGIGRPGFERDLASGVRAARACGCVGVKVWKQLGLWLRDGNGRRVAVDDPRLRALWDVAGEQRLPILIHVGDPPEFWQAVTPENPRYRDLEHRPQWWYGSGDFPALESISAELERVVACHPHTTFVGAHFGCFAPDPERWLASYANYNIDTAAAVAEIGKGDVSRHRRLFLDWPDRMLFGTDLVRTARFQYPDLGAHAWELGEFYDRHWRFFETAERQLEHPIPEQLPWKVTGLDLPDDVLRALYHDNTARLYDLPNGAGAQS
jgi:predicted TIM-barrel fold metal-dependent hydrolase